MPGKDIFYQKPCSNCGRYVYEEELRPDGAGGGICNSCFVQKIALGGKPASPLDHLPMPRGILIVEILGVVFVLAFIVGFVVQTVMPMKKKADMAKLELLYFANQDTEVGKLAEEAIALIEKEQSLDSLKKIMQSQSGDLRAAGTGQSAEAIVPRIDPKLTQGLTPEQKKDIEALEQLTASKHGEYIQSLENLTRGASINPGDIAELENELRKSMELRNRQQQVGSAISAIQEWQKKMERRSQDAKDPLSAFR